LKGELQMTDTAPNTSSRRLGIAALVLVVLLVSVWWFVNERETWPRGEALGIALSPLIAKPNSDQALVANIILENYREARANAARWSGVYWGFTFFAATLSALAALVLKLETLIKDEAAKKDIAATLAVVAALLMTISTSGDFQRKWQANRIAAAELERTGYEFLEKNALEPRSYLASVGQILHRRHLAIAGGSEAGKSAPIVTLPAPPGK
jgi:hypothetical protein